MKLVLSAFTSTDCRQAGPGSVSQEERAGLEEVPTRKFVCRPAKRRVLPCPGGAWNVEPQRALRSHGTTSCLPDVNACSPANAMPGAAMDERLISFRTALLAL